MNPNLYAKFIATIVLVNLSTDHIFMVIISKIIIYFTNIDELSTKQIYSATETI